ncbi:Os03g0692700, partial [Oryza sativa Japonica Group]
TPTHIGDRKGDTTHRNPNPPKKPWPCLLSPPSSSSPPPSAPPAPPPPPPRPRRSTA